MRVTYAEKGEYPVVAVSFHAPEIPTLHLCLRAERAQARRETAAAFLGAFSHFVRRDKEAAQASLERAAAGIKTTGYLTERIRAVQPYVASDPGLVLTINGGAEAFGMYDAYVSGHTALRGALPLVETAQD